MDDTYKNDTPAMILKFTEGNFIWLSSDDPFYNQNALIFDKDERWTASNAKNQLYQRPVLYTIIYD